MHGEVHVESEIPRDHSSCQYHLCMTNDVPVGFLWETCGFLKGAMHFSGTEHARGFQLWVSPCWYLPVPVWSYRKHKHIMKTFSPALQRHLMNAPLRFTWVLRQGTWPSLRDLSVWFKPLFFFFQLLSVTFYDVWIFHDSEIIQAHNIKNIHCIPSWKKKTAGLETNDL